MIRHLGRKHSVVAASLAHTEQELNEGAALKDYCDEVIAEVLPESTRRLQALKALPTGMPCSANYFWSARLHERIRKCFFHSKFDVVFVHCVAMAQYVMDLEADLRIMDFGDIDSAKWAEYSQSRRFPLSLVYAAESKKLRTYERYVAQSFHRCTVTSRGEKDEYQTFRVSTPCTLIPNGVDLSYFSAQRNVSTSRPTVVFLGRMDYFPNIDGVCYFAEQVFPFIRKKIPNVEFRIVGSQPAQKIQSLRNIPGIVVTGHVPDVRAYVPNEAVAIAPLRIARGTQNKILESMAMGIPVVATTKAAKGIQAVAGRDLLVADVPEEFAAHVIALLRDEQMRRFMSQSARNQLEKAHLWPASLSILDSLLADASKPTPSSEPSLASKATASIDAAAEWSLH